MKTTYELKFLLSITTHNRFDFLIQFENSMHIRYVKQIKGLTNANKLK
jgi:hypothetical protein